MNKKVLSTDQAPQAIGPYSQAIEAGDMIFTSGMIPIDPKTNTLVEGDIKVQAKQAIGNLKSLLEACGSDCDQVNEIYAQFFEKDCPARSCVEVARLPKDVLIEIEAVAIKK